MKKLEYNFTREHEFCLSSVLQKPPISIFPCVTFMSLTMENGFSEQRVYAHTHFSACPLHFHIHTWEPVGITAAFCCRPLSSSTEPTEVKAWLDCCVNSSVQCGWFLHVLTVSAINKFSLEEVFTLEMAILDKWGEDGCGV